MPIKNELPAVGTAGNSFFARIHLDAVENPILLVHNTASAVKNQAFERMHVIEFIGFGISNSI